MTGWFRILPHSPSIADDLADVQGKSPTIEDSADGGNSLEHPREVLVRATDLVEQCKSVFSIAEGEVCTANEVTEDGYQLILRPDLDPDFVAESQ